MSPTSDELRRTFLSFFVERGHSLRPQAPLVPRDDPTLLFTSAGMVQFKPWFSYGEERIGQGRENARLWLKEHPDAVAELEVKLREALGLTKTNGAPPEPVMAVADGKGERRVRI